MFFPVRFFGARQRIWSEASRKRGVEGKPGPAWCDGYAPPGSASDPRHALVQRSQPSRCLSMGLNSKASIIDKIGSTYAHQ